LYRLVQVVRQVDLDSWHTPKYTPTAEARNTRSRWQGPRRARPLAPRPAAAVSFICSCSTASISARERAVCGSCPCRRRATQSSSGVFAPASQDRGRVVPKTRGAAADQTNERAEASANDRQRALAWAQRLKRVFTIDIEVCRRCCGRLRVIASIEEPAVIERILEHLGGASESVDPAHASRAPPEGNQSL